MGQAPETLIGEPTPSLFVVWGLAPLVATWLLFLLQAPLGRPNFVYPYSSYSWWRFYQALPMLILGMAALMWIRVRLKRARGFSRWDGAAISILWAAFVAASFAAPPAFVRQHLLNFHSPSHDGAFVLEADEQQSWRTYVAEGFNRRCRLDPEDMRGTRVLSNPPGMTIVAMGLSALLLRHPDWEAALHRLLGTDVVEGADQRHRFAVGMLLAALLQLAWGFSTFTFYATARATMDAFAAAVVAACCVLTPATLEFTPGKDPAQLLFVGLILLASIRCFLFHNPGWGMIAGGGLALSLTVGLIHIWIAAILLVSMVWQTASSRGSARDFIMRCGLPVLGGFLMIVVLFKSAWDWDILAGVVTVARKYPTIQREIIHGWWTILGLPLFMLFAGPALWILLGAGRWASRPGAASGRADSSDRWARIPAAASPGVPSEAALRERAASWSGKLLWVSAAAMAYCYFFANNSETPRLWMPFLALLTWALAQRRDWLRAGAAGSVSTSRLCLLLLALQIGGSILHWTMMDVRESEMRLTTGRYLN